MSPSKSSCHKAGSRIIFAQTSPTMSIFSKHGEPRAIILTCTILWSCFLQLSTSQTKKPLLINSFFHNRTNFNHAFILWETMRPPPSSATSESHSTTQHFFISLPIYFNFSLNVSAIPDVGKTDLIAIGNTEAFQSLSTSDLANCKRFSARDDPCFKPIVEDCLGSLYLGSATLIKANCKF